MVLQPMSATVAAAHWTILTAKPFHLKRLQDVMCKGVPVVLLVVCSTVVLFDVLADVIVRFEASGMTTANGWLWVVFDNLHTLARIDEHFQV